MNSFNSGWYVIYTRPRHEKKVSLCLSESQMTFFLPMTKTLRTWCDRKKYIDMPLFPSYVFVYLRNMQDYYCGLNNDGVLYYVKMGKNIVCVGEDVISNIQLAVDKGNGVEVSENYFQPGQKLVVQKGPLTGLSCELIHYNGKQKLLVRVHLLQRNLLVTMPAEQLMAVSA